MDQRRRRACLLAAMLAGAAVPKRVDGRVLMDDGGALGGASGEDQGEFATGAQAGGGKSDVASQIYMGEGPAIEAQVHRRRVAEKGGPLDDVTAIEAGDVGA